MRSQHEESQLNLTNRSKNILILFRVPYCHSLQQERAELGTNCRERISWTVASREVKSWEKELDSVELHGREEKGSVEQQQTRIVLKQNS